MPRPSDATAAESQRWEETHRRVTFYCPDEVLDAIETEMARSDRSKTRVIVDALRTQLLDGSGQEPIQ